MVSIKYDNAVKRYFDTQVYSTWRKYDRESYIIVLDHTKLLSTKKFLELGVPPDKIILVENTASTYISQKRTLRRMGVKLHAHIPGDIRDVVAGYAYTRPVVYADLCSNDPEVINLLVQICADRIPHMFITFARRYRGDKTIARKRRSAQKFRTLDGPEGWSPCTQHILMPSYIDNHNVKVQWLKLYKSNTSMATMYITPGVTKKYSVEQIDAHAAIKNSGEWHL